ncbi:hypothetical protein [Limnoraphis robusta]|uniref:Uncharacterized protein n=1 Tax=Limnoraphis robusta CCNP1315 TaxID=3110306 RepID=A0ABU5U2G9_9CYAN|nr:hypothetical protein [Limnoraphis robusta]MEA5521386.1 hypothetical protein [Limnoraphis robusta CCNP1315]MEA5547937.1 hypothetical protein [Limnoraphis robusta CCNP1324]
MFEFELNQELKDIVTEYDAKILSHDLGRTVKPEEIVEFIREENLFLWVLYGLKFVVMTSEQYQQYCEDIAENEAELAQI